MTFFPAVMMAAYLVGFWPGLLATILSAVAAKYFLTGLFRFFRFTNVNDVNAIKELGIFWAVINEPPPGSVRRKDLD